jgi:hypothetical protein
MGPKGDLRALFTRAAAKAKETQRNMDNDDGSHGSDFMYHGSDQALFAVIFGEQEYQREVQLHLQHSHRRSSQPGLSP